MVCFMRIVTAMVFTNRMRTMWYREETVPNIDFTINKGL